MCHTRGSSNEPGVAGYAEVTATTRDEAGMSHLTVRPSALYRSARKCGRISVACAAIAAVWLTVASVRAEVIALVAAIAVVISGQAGMLAGVRTSVAIEWGLAGCGMLAEFVVYAGIAGAVGPRRHPARGGGNALNGTFVAGFGGMAPPGAAAGEIEVISPCWRRWWTSASTVRSCQGPGCALWTAGDVRLPHRLRSRPDIRCRAAFLVVFVLGVAALIVGHRRQPSAGQPWRTPWLPRRRADRGLDRQVG